MVVPHELLALSSSIYYMLMMALKHENETGFTILVKKKTC